LRNKANDFNRMPVSETHSFDCKAKKGAFLRNKVNDFNVLSVSETQASCGSVQGFVEANNYFSSIKVDFV
jgi:hypothetical protein